jgi:putative DNA primase/helicase
MPSPNNAALAKAQAEKPLLPEADQPGIKAMEQAATLIMQHGGRVRLVKIPAPGVKPDGHDVADEIADGKTADDLRAILKDQRVPAVAAKAMENQIGSGRASAETKQHAIAAQTEDAIAEAYELERTGQLAFDQSRKTWLIYDPCCGIWRPDRKEEVLYSIRLFVRAINTKDEARLGKASIVLNVERLCRMRQGFAITGDELDASPFILGTPAGLYNLETGALCKPDPAQFVTKSTACAPDFDDPALWLRFLTDATGGDQAVIDYLQRLAGYCLTGSTREEQLTFLWGPGGNGKGTFLGALIDIAGDYARSTSTDTFLESSNDRNKADLAVLAGKRLVVAQESNEGRKWDAQRVKSITGRDEMEARFLYANSFVFKPSFKLLIASNHRPRIPSVDESWRRRLHLLPFDRKPAQPDPLLKEKLRDEYPQILGWMIKGAEWWYREGLGMPQAVVDASKEYLREQDIVGQWFDECIEMAGGTLLNRREAGDSLKRWCMEMNHGAPTVHALTRWLKENKGIEQDVKKASRPYLGIRLKPAEYSPSSTTSPACANFYGGPDD